MIKHLSYSSISTYLLCPRAWRFRYLNKVQTPTAPALVFGSAVHGAIEDYLRAQAEQSNAKVPVSDHFVDNWSVQLERDQVINWGKDSAEKMAALGATMCGGPVEVTGAGPSQKLRNLSIFLNDLHPLIVDDAPVIEKRVEFTVPGVPVPIVGYIDMVASDGVPVDFKTASRAWYSKKAHTELQPAFYLLALLQDGYQSNPDGRFRYIVLTKTKKPKVQIIDTKRTVGQLFWLMDLIRETWEAISAGVFPPNPLTWKCPKYCEFSEMCLG
jgi:CRISPR/Cas system-associated exonuclease Cas4 (RecB family)